MQLYFNWDWSRHNRKNPAPGTACGPLRAPCATVSISFCVAIPPDDVNSYSFLVVLSCNFFPNRFLCFFPYTPLWLVAHALPPWSCGNRIFRRAVGIPGSACGGMFFSGKVLEKSGKTQIRDNNYQRRCTR